MLLVFNVIAYPDAQLDEITAFLANSSPDGKVYSRGEVFQRLNELHITRKCGTARRIKHLRLGICMFGRNFGNIPFLLVFVVPHEGDSSVLMSVVSRYNRRKESMATLTRACVRKPGGYSRDVKVTSILVEEPGFSRLLPSIYWSVEWLGRWAKVDPIPGTSTEDFDYF